MVLVLGIVKASLEVLGIGIGVKKVVLLMSGLYYYSILMASVHNLMQNFIRTTKKDELAQRIKLTIVCERLMYLPQQHYSHWPSAYITKNWDGLMK